MDLRQLEYFVRVAELGSFSRAAEQLDLPRASATQIIKQLETRLGVRLLLRTTRQVSTTLDGAAYYQRCVAILAEIDDAEASFTQAARHPQGKLKVDLPGSLARLRVIPALADFYRQYPQITLEIGIGDRYIDLVRDGVDCVLRAGELADSSLVARRLTLLPQVTCASAAYLAEYGMPHTLADLAAHRVVDYFSASSGKSLPLEFVIDGQTQALRLPAALAVNNADAYVAACEAGLGIVQAPRYHVAAQLATGTLVELLPQQPPPALPLALLYPQQRQLQPRLRVWLDWLSELFAAR